MPDRVVVHETTDPEVVIAEYDYRGEARGTGRTFVVSNVQIVRVRNGLIVHGRWSAWWSDAGSSSAATKASALVTPRW